MTNEIQVSAATKTPISYLNELCRKAQLVAKYDIEATEDLANGPLFVFKVSAGSIIATGKGSSKKNAKHNAAKNAIAEFQSKYHFERDSFFGELGDGQEGVEKKTNMLNMYADQGDEQAGNPVGELQEVSQKRFRTMPTYKFSDEQGPPHDREFVCSVSVFKYFEKAVGKSKKLAKRNAASLMLESIKQGFVHPSNNNDHDSRASNHQSVDVSPFLINESGAFQAQSFNGHASLDHNGHNATTAPSQQVASEKKISAMFAPPNKDYKPGEHLKRLFEFNFEKDLDEKLSLREADDKHHQNSHADTTNAPLSAPTSNPLENGTLQADEKVSDGETDLSHDPLMDLLSDLGREQAFQSNFYPIPPDDNEDAGVHKCLLKLTTTPQVIGHGMGNSAHKAKKEACYKALMNLQKKAKKNS